MAVSVVDVELHRCEALAELLIGAPELALQRDERFVVGVLAQQQQKELLALVDVPVLAAEVARKVERTEESLKIELRKA
jgi:hypothetical protein|tara:strand:- start:126 stop:362 length:237 start_codon:yes stop_codon:yes gene_type:complete